MSSGVSFTLPGTGVFSLILRDRAVGLERAVAVDHQPRIGLQDRVRVEFVGHEAHHRLDADIPGDVPAQFAFRHAEIAERARDAPSGMVADQQERRGALRPQVTTAGGSSGREQGGSCMQCPSNCLRFGQQ